MVLGADGMVGSGVIRSLKAANVNVVGTRRIDCDACDMDSIRIAIDSEEPDVVVNCIGIVPQRTDCDVESMIFINALFPHQLHRVWGGKLIHISTDCVFDDTVYGRSKRLGEVGMTLRCCVVGFSPKRKVSFLDWFVASPIVDGWRNAYFTPITNLELGRAIEKAATHYAEGVFNVSGERMSKHDYLHMVNAEFALGKTIKAVDEPVVDKSSTSGAFTELTGWKARSTVAQIRELVPSS